MDQNRYINISEEDEKNYKNNIHFHLQYSIKEKQKKLLGNIEVEKSVFYKFKCSIVVNEMNIDKIVR